MAKKPDIMVISDSSSTLATCSIVDPASSAPLMVYKGGGVAENHTLTFLGNDYLAAVEKNKPILHIWPLNSPHTVQGMRFILPGVASSFAATPDGQYCIAGIHDRIFLWQLSTGRLLTIIKRHYQKVALLKFTADGRHFVSAAEDGMVMVWSMVTVTACSDGDFVTQSTAGEHDPLYIFSDHSLPVTDMYISKNGLHGRLFTVSSDRSCKVYDLTCGKMLLNLVFEEPLSSITLDGIELNAYVGTAEGKIFHYSLAHPPRERDLLLNNTELSNSCFAYHTKAVVTLSVAVNGNYLLSGSNDENLIVWHINSRQTKKVYKLKGVITNAFYSMNYKAIYQQEFTPSILLHPLERTLESNNENTLEIQVLIKKDLNFWPKIGEDTQDLENPFASKEMEYECKQKEAKLRLELEKMKQINASLYAASIENVLKGDKKNRQTVNSNSKKKKKKSTKKYTF